MKKRCVSCVAVIDFDGAQVRAKERCVFIGDIELILLFAGSLQEYARTVDKCID